MDELVRDFITETKESITTLDNDLILLEEDYQNRDLVSRMFRVFHTIKGTCGFIGLDRLAKIAHHTENVLGKIRDGELIPDSEIVSQLLKANDKIQSIIAEIETQGSEPDGDDSKLVESLEAIAEGHSKSNDNGEQTTSIAISEEQPVEISFDVAVATEEQIVEHGLKFEPKVKEVTTPSKMQSESANQSASIRVKLSLLEKIMEDISELVLTRNQLIQIARRHHNNPFASSIARLNLITSDLQEKLMKTRMQPINTIWSNYPRVIRDISHDLQKKIAINMIGADTELDRQLLEAIKDPLMHMLRNSCDHGIEPPADRLKAGKSEQGTVTLKAYQQGGQIVIEIKDDGKGLGIEKIKQKVIEKQLASSSELEKLTDQQIFQFIFQPGFSTAAQVTSVSGRGVGMDVVKTNIEKVNGTVELYSALGVGTTFFIKIPLTLSIMPVLIINAGGERFGIPQINILQMIKVSENSQDYKIEYLNNRETLRLRDSIIPVVSLASFLNVESLNPNNQLILLCDAGGMVFGIKVDAVYDTEEIVVKPISPILKNLGIYSGTTVLGDGSVIMILDPSVMVKNLSELQHQKNILEHTAKVLTDKKETASFLIFKSNDKLYGVPLETVKRLEDLDFSKLEYAAGFPVLQYRNTLMYVMNIEEQDIPASDLQQVIVFHDDSCVLGLVTQDIVDIVEQNIDNAIPINEPKILLSQVVNGITVDIININYFFKKISKTLMIDESSQQFQGNGTKILFIDDSAFFRKSIPTILGEKGFNVTTVDSATKAYQLLEAGLSFNLIITDLHMPEMDGEEFAIQCANDNRFQNIPIIALSSNISSDIIGNLEAHGFVAYASKTNQQELFYKISDVLKARTVNAN